jgi:hypothetical protein
VKAVYFGGLEFDIQQANYTLGPLRCKGNKPFQVTESCQSLQKAGHTTSGYYLTSTPAIDHIDVTYCDMTVDVGEDGFQTDTLARLPKTMIAFDAYRTSEYTTARTVIPYDAFEMQVGGGMNLATGVFTAPIVGVYQFTGTWRDWYTSDNANVKIRKNGAVIARTYSHTADDNSFGMTVLLSLAKGDTVESYLEDGRVYSSSDRLVHFTGHLIYVPM